MWAGTALNELPIPDEPRKRNTRGCSSSYQPFSFLLIAREHQDMERKTENPLFCLLCFSTKFSSLLGAEQSRPEGGRYPGNDDKRVENLG